MSNNFKGGLVRLKKDIDLFDGKVEYVPDIVLCTRLILERYFKYIQNKAGKGSIINATWSNLSDVLSLFRDLNIFTEIRLILLYSFHHLKIFILQNCILVLRGFRLD